MKKISFIIFFILCLLITGSISNACTVFNTSDGSRILVGNNEDGFNTDARAWFIPANRERHGAIYFGFDDAWCQGGMNDQGLFIDWATEEPQVISYPEFSRVYKGAYNILFSGNLNEKILQECSTVNEALGMYNKYREFAFENAHVMIADKSGKSVIVEPFSGSLKVSDKMGNYQFMTNFNILYGNHSGYYCKRYDTLKKMLPVDSTPSLKNARTLLNSVHQDITVYSNIYDLKNGEVYLYYLHNYNKEIKFNLQEELKKGKHIYYLKKLFNIDQPNYRTENLNNQNPFLNNTTVNLLIPVFLLAFMLWPVKYLITATRGRTLRTGGVRYIDLAAFSISSLTGLLFFILLLGLVKHGFFIRYGFSFFQSILAVIPYAVTILTVVQVFLGFYLWISSRSRLYNKIIFSIMTIGYILALVNMQSWCWRLF